MKFRIKATEHFYKQLDGLDEKSRKLVESKLELLKRNPYRYKKLHGHNLKLFRIRLSLAGQESRLVYTVIEPDVVLICLLKRSKDYRDLRKYVRKLERE